MISLYDTGNGCTTNILWSDILEVRMQGNHYGAKSQVRTTTGWISVSETGNEVLRARDAAEAQALASSRAGA